MAGTDPTKVFVGAPEQSGVSGAVARGDLGATVPTTARDTLDTEEYRKGGYVSNDGVTISPNYSTSSITDWSGAEVRKILETFTGTASFGFIQIGHDEAILTFGEEAVGRTPASATHGEQISIALGARLPEPGVWVFSVKDGPRLVKIVLPNAQPVNVVEIKLGAASPITYGTELACYPDGDGNSIYILTDDGVFSA